MIIFFSIIIILAIVGIVLFLVKILKEEKEFAEEERKTQIEEEKNNPQVVAVKLSTILKDEEFEKLLLEAENDSMKMDVLKRSIQDNLRNCIKMKDMEGSRKCNMQLKKIDLFEREGNLKK